MHLTGLLKRLLEKPSQHDEEATAYHRLAERGFRPDGIIDIGAYEGGWTRSTREVFPAAASLMVEPQEIRQEKLQAVCRELPRTRLAPCLLGAESGKAVTFYEMGTGSSYLEENSDAPRQAKHFTLSMLDDVADDFPGENLFLKIDSQGAEIEILKGGRKTLQRSGLVQLETAVMAYNQGAPTMLEVLAFMQDNGFVPLDISGHTRIQGHLVQVDFLFTPQDSPLRKTFFNFQTS
ncbi:FkbM family methyltransferase [Porphyrobacter algicida]|uniref:FkbM family methyltransferase n=1 Tax=Qipengyuania algicida TaxID=1836209 RepID=A0A845AD08_9SPHN|nr:FkbM family methyltransferase [Qipengyuania algicida]MXP27269.1 FkbM family methyltransferase [Qipengyuania algicida]